MFGHALQLSSLLALLLPAAAPPSRVPSIDRMLSLEWPEGAHISPDGKYVAYEVQTTDWEANDFPTHLRLAVRCWSRR